jgi:hypothetical protein
VKLRKLFLKKYKIIRLNIFEERVFDDTSYTVCSFQFQLKDDIEENEINIHIFPSKKELNVILNEENGYIIGGEIYKLKTSSNYTITRLTSKNKDEQNTNILVKCIDDSKKKQIKLEYVSDDDIYIDETPNLSARTYATLVIKPKISKKKQKEIVEKFNEYLLNEREKYHSLFLTNYRESKGDISRKRISFDLVYNIVSNIVANIYKQISTEGRDNANIPTNSEE